MLSYCSNAGRINAERQGGCEWSKFHLWKVSRLHQIHASQSYSLMPGSKLDRFCGLVMMSPRRWTVLCYQDGAWTLNNSHQLLGFMFQIWLRGAECVWQYSDWMTEIQDKLRNIVCSHDLNFFFYCFYPYSSSHQPGSSAQVLFCPPHLLHHKWLWPEWWAIWEVSSTY